MTISTLRWIVKKTARTAMIESQVRVNDVTDRRLAAEAVRDSEERLELKEGMAATALFKASSVILGVG